MDLKFLPTTTRSAPLPLPVTLVMPVVWATTHRHRDLNTVANVTRSLHFRRRATTTRRPRSSRYTALLSGLVHFRHFDLGSFKLILTLASTMVRPFCYTTTKLTN
jgi:hypothetical protein